MNNIPTTLLFFFLYIFFLNGCNSTIKHKFKHDNIKIKDDNRYRKRNKREKLSKRKLQDTGDEEEFPFLPLNIYLDKEEFLNTFPPELEDYKNNYLNAMENAKAILEDFLEIKTDTKTVGGKKIVDSKVGYVTDNYGVTHYTDVFKNNYLSVNEYNYYIFGKFTSELGEESASVILDDFAGAPLVGIVLFNNNTDTLDKTKLTLEYLTSLMLHHFIRLLGFNSALAEPPYDYIPSEKVNGNTKYYLATEDNYNFSKLINYARKYFNCPSIDKIYLYVDDENLDELGSNYEYTINDIIGLYWPKRLFLGELLTKFDYPEEQILSGFTLAFLDDLPYLRVTKNYSGGSLKFGKNKGCEFFYNYCGNSSNSLSTFSNEFFLPNDEEIFGQKKPSCSSGRLSKTIYKLEEIKNEDKGNEDLIFEYYLGEKVYGGSRTTNFCPMAQFDESSTNRYIYSGRCSEESTLDPNDNPRKEVISDNSFCVLSSLDDSSNSESPELMSLCYEMICSSRSLTIKIGENYIVCPREGGKVKAEGFNGYLLCPDYYLICGSLPLCNNLLKCLESNSVEKEESFDYDYNEIKTTQNPTIYEEDYRDYGWEETDGATCPKFCMQCKSYTDCTKCAPHYIFKNSQCVYAIEHCIRFVNEESDTCSKCEENYFVVENSDGTRYCETGSIDQYYTIIDTEDLKVYKKCEMDNCDECQYTLYFASKVKCISCSSPFKPIDDGEFCGDPSTKLYYEDSTDIFKSCTKHAPINTCSKCEIIEGSFTCLECTTNYVLYYGNTPPSCLDKTSIDDTMYTTDNKNYYPCNNREYHDIDNCVKCNKRDECQFCSNSYTLVNGNRLCLLTAYITNKEYYQNPDNNYYYKCPDSCPTCDSPTKCLSCASSYLMEETDICIDKNLYDEHFYYQNVEGKLSSCSKIQDCNKCLSATECIECINGKYLVKVSDSQYSCQSIDTNKYYPTNDGRKTYYQKCEDAITNCDECSANNYCTKCKMNFGIVDNLHFQCLSLIEEKYYYDTDLETFKLCSNKMPNCEFCSTYGDFVCKKCFSSYALKHDNDNIQCIDKTTLSTDKHFFTNDSEINYYSCQFHHVVKNCYECSNSETCDQCMTDYDSHNNDTLCARQSDIDNNIFIWTNGGILKPCSDLIKDCHQCNDSSTCYNCQEGAGLIDNDTCINKTILEESKEWFIDEGTQRYVSCSVISNCITCDSSTVCTSCKSGFSLNNNICNEIVNNDDNDDGGLGTGPIIGIVFGCLGFLLLAAGVVYFLFGKIFKKNNVQINRSTNERVVVCEEKHDKVPENEEKALDNVNQNQIEVHTVKRSIHNE